jgi:NDP-sugar pyrophosphorylase family protein
MRLPVAILAGGLANRIRPLTESIPKSLLEVAGKPFAEHQLELLASHGIKRIVFCVNHLGQQMVDTLGDGSRWKIRIDYAFDGPIQLGTGGALQNALHLLGEEFLILYGDSYLQCDYEDIERAFLASGRLGLMTVLRNANQWDKSNILFSDGNIYRYDKTGTTLHMQHIDYGLGALRARALRGYPVGQPLDLTTVYQDLIAAEELAAYEVHTRFYEIGSYAGLQETRAFLARKISNE